MRHSTRNFRPALERLEERALLSAAPALAYVQTNLVSNIQGKALITDPKLVNPWDINFPQQNGLNPPIFVADQGAGLATSYQISSDGSQVIESSSPVTIPTSGSSEPSGPTGVVQNTDSQGFFIPGPEKGTPAVSASYIFDTLQGAIGGFAVNNPDTGPAQNTGPVQITDQAQIMVPNSSTGSTGAEYTGLATGIVNGQDFIYAANEGTTPGIQVFNSSFGPSGEGIDPTDFTGNFTDLSLSAAGFMPYGVRDLSLGAGGKQDAYLFVTYRSPNFQGGAIAVFTNSGMLMEQINNISGNLQSPWGLAYIGQNLFGDVGGDLLVGNFSSGQIDAYAVTANQSPNTPIGQFLGPLLNANGTPLTIPGLQSVHFGPGLGDSGFHVALLFTADSSIPLANAGGNGNISLYGMITPNITTVETPRPPAVLGADGSLSLLYPGGKQLLSPPGAIAAVSAVTDASGGTDVYVITTAGHTLWEHTSAGWAETSAGYFQQISAATNSAGNAVVFGILGAGAGPYANSLWEDSSLNPGGWAMLSPGGTILSISAGLNDDVYAITVAGNTLWEHTQAGWAELSSGSFQSISAGLNDTGQAVVYAVAAGGSLWEQNPSNGVGLNIGWQMLSPLGAILSITAGGPGEVFAITAAGPNNLWEHSDSGWSQLSLGTFASVSAPQYPTPSDVVFAVLSNGSFWEYDTGLSDPWLELLASGAASSSA